MSILRAGTKNNFSVTLNFFLLVITYSVTKFYAFVKKKKIHYSKIYKLRIASIKRHSVWKKVLPVFFYGI